MKVSNLSDSEMSIVKHLMTMKYVALVLPDSTTVYLIEPKATLTTEYLTITDTSDHSYKFNKDYSISITSTMLLINSPDKSLVYIIVGLTKLADASRIEYEKQLTYEAIRYFVDSIKFTDDHDLVDELIDSIKSLKLNKSLQTYKASFNGEEVTVTFKITNLKLKTLVVNLTSKSIPSFNVTNPVDLVDRLCAILKDEDSVASSRRHGG